jgi:hypothetical protein
MTRHAAPAASSRRAISSASSLRCSERPKMSGRTRIARRSDDASFESEGAAT